MCKVATIRNVARRKNWTVGNVDAELSQVVRRNDEGQLVPKVSTTLSIQSELSKEQQRELINEADNCYIHRLLKGQWNIEPSIEVDITANETINK